MDIVDACMTGTFDLSSVTQFGPVINYNIYKPADVQSTTAAEVTESETVADCPALEFAVVNQDGSALDAAVFSEAGAFDFSTFSDQIGKIGSYDLKLTVKYAGSQYTLTGEKSFQVIISDPCKTAVLSFVSSI